MAFWMLLFLNYWLPFSLKDIFINNNYTYYLKERVTAKKYI